VDEQTTSRHCAAAAATEELGATLLYPVAADAPWVQGGYR